MSRPVDDLIAGLCNSLGACRDENAELAIRVAMAEAERDSYRAVMVAAIHYAHALDSQLEKLKARHHLALDEARRLRVTLLEQSEPAA